MIQKFRELAPKNGITSGKPGEYLQERLKDI
jgi:hypothetical protein